MNSRPSRRELLKWAVEVEKSAAAFYKAASAPFKELKVAFERLSDEEEDHARMYTSLLSLPDEAIPGAPGAEAERHLHLLMDEKALDRLLHAATMAGDLRDSFDAVAAALSLEKDTLLLYYAFTRLLTGEDRRTVQTILEIEKRHLSDVADLIVRGQLLFKR